MRWENITLGEVAPSNGCEMPNESKTVWNLSLEDIESHTGRILAVHMCKVSDLGSSKCSFDQRHVLYSKLRPYLNKVVIPDQSGVGTSELIPLTPDPDRLDREFLGFYLRSPEFLKFAAVNTRGANLPRIAMNELWNHQVPMPASVNEQRRIVACIKECMERVNEIEALRASSTDEASAVLPSMLNEVFTKLASQYPSKGIGDMAIETRYGTSQKCNTSGVGMPILRIPNVAGGFVNYEDLKHCPLSPKERERVGLQTGDLLFVRTNGSRELVGRCAVFDSNKNTTYGFASYLIRVRLDPKVLDPYFLAFFLNSTNGRVELDKRRRTSAGQFNINSENLRNIGLPVPPIDQQRHIVSELHGRQERVMALLGEISHARSEQVLLRESILRKAFAGEL